MSGKIKPKLKTENKQYDNRQEIHFDNSTKKPQKMISIHGQRKRDLTREKSEAGEAELEV